jgi:hypothetical protein
MVATNYIMQSGSTKRLAKSGRPNLMGYAFLAHMVLRAMKAHALRSSVSESKGTQLTLSGGTPKGIPDCREALDAMSWKVDRLPANLAANYAAESITEFASDVVFFPSFRGWGKFPLGEPIDWGMAGANWSWQSYFTGLEFVRPAMAFWYDTVTGGREKMDPAIARVIEERGKTPDDLMRRAGAIIVDFIRANPPTAPKNQRAYFQGTILRRVKAFLTYLVCAKKADAIGRPFDTAEVETVFRSLAECMEMLKSDDVYPKAGNHGVRQDALFIVAGLLWHSLPYGRELLDLGMNRLQTQQLDRALSSDGVWLENSFGYHCLIMNQLTMTAEDLRMAGAPGVDVIHDALRRMSEFVEAMVKCDGYGPLLGDTAPKRQFVALAEAAMETTGERLQMKNFRRAKDTYFFPAAGYFASHSSRELSPDASTLITSATLSRPKHKQADDLSIVFTHGTNDLLVDGGTFNKEITDTVRNAARYDPASHNTYRINGSGYPVRAMKGTKPAGLSAMWDGDGWAAVRGFNNAYKDGKLARLVVHLKRRHAVIVLDQLMSKSSSPATFEQFWHIAPDFPPEAAKDTGQWLFASKENGVLRAAFGPEAAECTLEHGGPDNPIAWLMLSNDEVVPTPYLRRSCQVREGVMASLFQWTPAGADAQLAIEHRAGDAGTVELSARGAGFDCRFRVGEREVACVELNDHGG